MKEGNHLRFVGIDGSKILKLKLNKLSEGGILLDSSCSGQGKLLGCCAHGNEPSCSIKSGEFADWLWSCWLLHKHSAEWSSLVFCTFYRDAQCITCVLCFVAACVHAVLPYSTYTAPHSHKLCVISPYNCKCRPPHYKIFQFSVRWNIRIRRQMMRHSSLTQL